ncbi:MAG: hypothetical protein SGCHY_005573, partial [Lobulomycetales sp.]
RPGSSSSTNSSSLSPPFEMQLIARSPPAERERAGRSPVFMHQVELVSSPPMEMHQVQMSPPAEMQLMPLARAPVARRRPCSSPEALLEKAAKLQSLLDKLN